MIPIKNPNISTNRYNKLLQTEKYYKECCVKYRNEINENLKLKEENDILQDNIYILEEGIEDIIYELEHNPKQNAEIKDKYIIEKLKNLLESKGE